MNDCIFYLSEIEVLEPVVAPFVLAFPLLAFSIFALAVGRKDWMAFHGATSFGS